MGVACKVGCQCMKHRHVGSACTAGCECGRHRETGRVCESGCTCGRHTASHGSGWKWSDESRAQLSASVKEHVRTPEHCAAISMVKKGIRPNHAGFAGRSHTVETRAKMSAASLGKPKSESHRLALARHLAKHHHPTKIENILVDIVLAEFPTVIREKRFGHYRVDAYLPAPYHLAFEADGAYWHDEQRDAVRDEQLLSEFDLPVIRLSERELLKVA